MWEIYEFMNNVDITLSDEEMTKIKVVDLGEFYNFVAGDFCSRKSFVVSKSYLKFSFLKIQNLNCSNQITWKDDQNESCRSWKVIEICSWQLFDFRSCQEKLCLKYSNLKFKYFKRPWMEKQPKWKL